MMTCGRPLTRAYFVKSSRQRGHVMAIATRNVPAESLEFGLEIAEVARLAHPDIRLHLVVIDNDGNAVDLVIGRGNERFPNLAFLQFAVAGHHKEAAIASRKPIGERHALGFRNAHAKRAGV